MDDGSTDATPAILAAAAARDPRVRVERLARSGHTRATRHAIDLARGELLAHCDHDDVWLPTRLERGVAFLDAFPDVAVVGTGATVVDANDRPLGEHRPSMRPRRGGAAAPRRQRDLPLLRALPRVGRARGGGAPRGVPARERLRPLAPPERALPPREPPRSPGALSGALPEHDRARSGVGRGGGVAARAAARARREGRPDVVEDRPYEVSELLRVVGADLREVHVEGFGLALYLAELARVAQARERRARPPRAGLRPRASDRHVEGAGPAPDRARRGAACRERSSRRRPPGAVVRAGRALVRAPRAAGPRDLTRLRQSFHQRTPSSGSGTRRGSKSERTSPGVRFPKTIFSKSARRIPALT